MTIEMANRLQQYRKSHNLSQEELAARIGVSRQAVSKWERAEASPDTDNLILLAKLYGISLDTLVYAEPEPYAAPLADPAPVSEPASDTVLAPTPDLASNPTAESEPPAYPAPPSIEWTEESAGNKYMTESKKAPKDTPNSVSHHWAYAISYPMICIIAYLLFGFLNICGGWASGWLVFFSIPLYYTLIEAVERHNPETFCYPVLVTWLYLWFGFRLALWHPMWILFLTIPIYYGACEAAKKK